MGLKSALTHTVLPRRNYLIKSIVAATLLFFVFSAATLYVIALKNEQQQQLIGARTVQFSTTYLQNLTDTMKRLGHMPDKSCDMASDQLSRDAALTLGVREFLLVREGMVYCSSATGEMTLTVEDIFSRIDWHKPLDIQLEQGTRFVPNRPVIAIWYRDPDSAGNGVLATIELTLSPYLLFTQNDEGYHGFALIIGDSALTSISTTLIPIKNLPDSHYSEIKVGDYPFTLRLYAPQITGENIRFTLLAAILLSLMVGALIYFTLVSRHNPEREIILGLRDGQFFVEYQPVMETQTLKVAGLEALMRWQHPVEGRIPPDIFISYAESQGMIVPLTQRMMQLAAADAHRLKQVMPFKAKFGINISPHHMNKVSFRDDVMNFLSAMPEDHFQIVFEITERGMIDNENALREFNWLRHQGIEIAIDDFGTGHSALIYLEKFTLDYLKIDRGFVMSIDQNTLIAPVLDTVLKLTEELKLKTVAEGVETVQQAEYLRNHGVTLLQGYLYSKPLSVEELMHFTLETNGGDVLPEE
ncbi:cyclic di-GMP phosphodiesterase [Ewingella americana]|uniref:cyclic-guanylate-specific phosphodiesterase n=1 Tax=Ewingella americana TaxID=41202 RepID=A0A502GPM3_9GAMM|nr:cyclic di-GMP phosphodiesterase [Ewingella americana]TPG63462.1 cyclic di-GMP phosphodiesterase [Ewingella americana]